MQTVRVEMSVEEALAFANAILEKVKQHNEHKARTGSTGGWSYIAVPGMVKDVGAVRIRIGEDVGA